MPAYLEEWVEYLPEAEEALTTTVVYANQAKRLDERAADELVNLMAMIWKEPNRHALSLAVAGVLAKGGYTQDDALWVVQRVCNKTGDREARDRQTAVSDTYKAAALGQPVRNHSPRHVWVAGAPGLGFAADTGVYTGDGGSTCSTGAS